MGETDDFEWDDDKDAANRTKHGLPLTFGTFIFDGRPRLERASPKIVLGEPRTEAMAELAGRVILCVFVWRGRRRRLISVRRAHRSERRVFAQAIDGS
ncbi:BrnT family toxin [Ancylobacter sp. MQZ15Z-1]|uniref:BrnT family toxin n=1 Tax=Ancylobacter mangrovi TaxID=2972472 RepID=A0A9X2P9U2_9HYPH|nr:BrnT family toxin [Ancylobacter mangrovi]MCS0494696.1 BrnT family toxin [Ancylobacter mangrovi]